MKRADRQQLWAMREKAPSLTGAQHQRLLWRRSCFTESGRKNTILLMMHMIHRIKRHPLALAVPCLFGSGFCALLYQTTWLREFRFIFGASTAASAAVVALFMGGLGLGSVLLGKVADRHPAPFQWYGKLELGITLAAAVSPLLLWGARSMYIGLGGSLALGTVGGSIVRLLLAAVVLLGPTFLMGGTLPAAMVAVRAAADPQRRRVALLYGINTAGAVTGALLATFVLLEHLGNRQTLWLACLFNLVVALAAIGLGRTPAPEANAPITLPAATSVPPIAEHGHPVLTQRWLVYAAAAIAGFAFFLMELVWYRMLNPLLGGSTFTFGLILAVALLGIAAGSLGYSLFGARRKATWRGLAWISGLEAGCIALPFALGDRLVLWAIFTEPIGNLSFTLRVLQWCGLCAVVVLPGAVAAGAQFPMLIRLLGRGQAEVGAHTGFAYGWNTLGAILGTLAGGFGLLTWLGALGAWRLAVILLVGLSLVALAQSVREAWRPSSQFASLLAAGAALWMLTSLGPTAVWRQTSVGTGRVEDIDDSPNGYKGFVRECRRMIQWEVDGKESNIALASNDGYALLVNGHADGHATGDAATQVMSGLLGALLHPQARSTCVIGLGTGSTAGWLAAVPEVTSVDVVELEPAVRGVAAACAPVNRHVLDNPKVHLVFGDAREVLLTTRSRYDLIFSEPSNPYRAGVASLFTREFYQAITRRLQPNGLFIQWVQAYEIDGASMSCISATLADVFPAVEIWRTAVGDLLFLCSQETIRYDLPTLRRRITQSPFTEALNWVWYVNDVEGLFAHYLANSHLCRAVVAAGVPPNTDDRNPLEFAMARRVGQSGGMHGELLRAIARRHGWDHPQCSGGELDATKLSDRIATSLTVDKINIMDLHDLPKDVMDRAQAKQAFAKGDLKRATQYWERQPQAPEDPYETYVLALAYAAQHDERALPLIQQLRQWRPSDADAILAQYYWERNEVKAALPWLEKALAAWRQAPWAGQQLIHSTLKMIQLTSFGPRSRGVAERVYRALAQPLAVRANESERVAAWLSVAEDLDGASPAAFTRLVMVTLEPYFPWRKDYLQARAACYRHADQAEARQARRELAAFVRNESRTFVYQQPSQFPRIAGSISYPAEE